MDAQVLPIAVTAGVSVLTTLLALLYGPAWKDRIDVRRAKQQRSDQLLARYSEPLARAAFDLQSRLYNICKQGFITATTVSDEYRRCSTLWLFGQFLAWTEIVRREIQVIDYGDVSRTAELQRHLFDVSDILSSDSIGDRQFRIFRAEQRAIGELMVIDRTVDGQVRTDSMGYAEFVRCMETESVFSRWFEPLADSMDDLSRCTSVGPRASLIQRSLIDLIDFFDPTQVRFPDVNERGKVPMPVGMTDRKRRRPLSEISRFRHFADPFLVVKSWAAVNKLRTVEIEQGIAVRLPRRILRTFYLAALQVDRWTELHVVRDMSEIGRETVTRDEVNAPAQMLSLSQTMLVNGLLRDLDRPRLVRRNERLSPLGR